ncbi:MAG TPA: hypothetical protein VNL14_11580 [Candidatus Acidoferrales bacterium]|nr:hypothetical protein [Candidatus Acidoferrales bacterium]
MILNDLDRKCVICGHPKCRRCREVSLSNLACCQCRARALRRLQQLAGEQNKEAPDKNGD